MYVGPYGAGAASSSVSGGLRASILAPFWSPLTPLWTPLGTLAALAVVLDFWLDFVCRPGLGGGSQPLRWKWSPLLRLVTFGVKTEVSLESGAFSGFPEYLLR